MTDFFITIPAIGRFPRLSIAEQDFVQIRSAKAVLVEAGAFEERYEILRRNYDDLEDTAASWPNRFESNQKMSTAIIDMLYDANRHLMNLLSSAKSYVDQAGGDFKDWQEGRFAREAKIAFSQQYDASSEYRLMEALRNHVQHAGLPCKSLSITHLGADNSVVEFHGAKAILSENKKFKPSVLAEMPDSFDLLTMAREYTRCLTLVHEHLRKVVGPCVDGARELLLKWRSDFKRLHHGESAPMAAIQFVDGNFDAQLSLNLDWDDERFRLAETNKLPLKRAREKAV